MKALNKVIRILLLAIRLILWILVSPLIIAICAIKMSINRLKFKSALIKSGMSKQWAIRLSRRYNMNFRDLIKMMKKSKNIHIPIT